MYESQQSKPVPVPSPADSAQPVSTQAPPAPLSPGGRGAGGEGTAPAIGLRYGRFALQRFHAKGGLGEVHVAFDEELNREVALKRMQPRCAGDPSALRRFLNEAEITARLEHPGIVPIYGLVQDEQGQPCYAMRFIAGQSLAEAIKNWHAGDGANYDALAFRQLLQRFISVCQTMAYAHSKNVIHRDLKPANIMLGPFGETLVVDWGLAPEVAVKRDAQSSPDLAFSRDAESSERSAADDLLASTGDFSPSPDDERVYTQAGQALGTLGYMPPEQAAGHWDLVGPCSDIYSLGATLYEMLTAQRAIRGPDKLDALQKAQAGQFSPPRQVKPDVPKPLAAICLKAMALKPQDRYATATDLAADVEHWLADEPISAYGEPWPVRAGRWARKHKAVTATALTVLLTTTLGLAAGLYFVNAERERTDEAWKAEAVQTQLAQKNEKLAQENDEISRAVLKFVEDKVFSAARPKDQEGGQGYDVKLADAVKSALPFVEKSFINQPLIEARLRMAMGNSFLYLGDTQTAAKQFEAGRALYTQHRGSDHPATLSSMNNLANSYDAAGRTQEALQLYEEALKAQKAKLGPDHPETLISMNNLANSYNHTGRPRDALQLREETFRLTKAKLGPEHPATLSSMNNLAVSYDEAGRRKEALKLRQEALALYESTLGPDHPDTLMSMHNLAISYALTGRTQDALELVEKTLKLRKAKLGPDHPDTLKSMHNLAHSYAAAGRTREALKLNEEMLKLRKAKLGPDHPDTLRTMHNLAYSYADAGRTQEALQLREETLKLQRAKLGPDHPDTLTSMMALANSYAADGRTREALQLYEEALKAQKAKLGPEHPDTLISMNNLANSYIDAGRIQDALSLLLQTVELRQRRVQAEPGDNLQKSFLAGTHGQMGLAEQARFDYAAAVQAYAKSVELFEKLDQAGALKHPFFRGRLNLYRQQLALCRKAEQAVRDLNFALKQPAAEVPQLLDMRLRYLLKEQKLPAAVESAAKIKELAGDKVELLYNAACAYALCAGAAKDPSPPAPLLQGERGEKLAEEAVTLLKQAVAKGYNNAAHMKQDKDLDALRQRPDFQRLLGDLEKKTPPPQLPQSAESKK